MTQAQEAKTITKDHDQDDEDPYVETALAEDDNTVLEDTDVQEMLLAYLECVHLFFEKLGVRAVVTSKQSPHLFLPRKSFGPQGHKVPAESQPRITYFQGTRD